MEGRRPRLKPSVNLQPKRRSATDTGKVSSSPSSSASQQNFTTKNIKDENEDIKHESITDEYENVNNVTVDNSIENVMADNNVNNNKIVEKLIEKDDGLLNVKSPFKRPPDVRNSLPSESDTINIEINSTLPLPSISSSDNQQIIPLSSAAPASTATIVSTSPQSQLSSKHRQRIRPTPYFGGGRRSSIQGNSINDLDEEHRRQRHLSEQGGHQQLSTEKISLNSANGDTDTAQINDVNNVSNITTSTVTHKNQITPRYRKTSSSDDFVEKSATGVKRTSSKFNAKLPEKSAMKMLDFIYYNPPTNPMNSVLSKKTDETTVNNSTIKPSSNEKIGNTNTTNEVSTAKSDEQENAPAMPVPQLKLGPNGEVIIDEQSLVIETTAQKEGRRNLLNSNVVYLDENTGNNGFYKRQKRTKEWTAEETFKFYRCLHTLGTDFSLMILLFPNRTRRDLKLKYKKEERINTHLVDKALSYPKTFNLEELKCELENDEKRLKDKRFKNRTIQEQTKKKIKANKRLAKCSSTVSRILTSGDELYEMIDGTAISHSKKRRKVKEVVKNSNSTKKKKLSKAEEENKNSSFAIDEQIIFETLVNVEDDNSDVLKAETLINSNDSNKIQTIQTTAKTVTDKFNLSSNILDDIDKILTELANGSLVLVSSEDPINPDKVINEIYVLCKESGQLSDKPLDLPEDVINCIVSEAFK